MQFVHTGGVVIVPLFLGVGLLVNAQVALLDYSHRLLQECRHLLTHVVPQISARFLREVETVDDFDVWRMLGHFHHGHLAQVVLLNSDGFLLEEDFRVHLDEVLEDLFVWQVAIYAEQLQVEVAFGQLRLWQDGTLIDVLST